MTKISVENIGPIAAGEVELKPLTIFIGPSNTGKSYMAGGIHLILKGFGRLASGLWSVPRGPYTEIAQSKISADSHLPSLDEVPGVAESFVNWVATPTEVASTPDPHTLSVLPDQIQSTLESLTIESLRWLQAEVLAEWSQTFGDEGGFARRRHDLNCCCVIIKRDHPHLECKLGETIQDGMAIDFSTAKAPIPGVDLKAFNSPPTDQLYRWLWDEFLYGMRDSVAAVLTEGLPTNSFYLPASRAGVVQAFLAITASQNHDSIRLDTNLVEGSTLPGVTTEFLRNLIGMVPRVESQARASALTESINFIETQVLHGHVLLDDSRGLPYPEVVFEQIGVGRDATRFSLGRTSSIVAELSPFILFLKYLIRPGDLLILEEPESHLHPAAQRQMARGIVRLVNAGVKVLITTHSDLFLAAINNLMRLSFAGEDKLSELGFEREDCLSHDDVSAYRFAFDETAGGSFVHELEIRHDVGIDDEEFGKVVNELYDETIAVEQIPIK